MALTEYLGRASSRADQEKVIKRLSAQMQLNQQLAGLSTLDELLWRGAEAKGLVEADQLFLYAVIDGELVTRAAGDDGQARRFQLPLSGESIPGLTALTAEVVNISDVGDAAQLAAAGDGLVYDRAVFAPLHGEPVRQVLCAPVVHNGASIGVIEAINKITGEAFDFMDVACLQEAAKNLAPQMHQVGLMQIQSDRLTYTEQFNQIVHRIHSCPDIDQILLSVHDQILEMFNVTMATIYAVDRENGELFSKVKGQEETVNEIRVPIDHSSIAGHCAATETLLNIADVYDDTELMMLHRSLTFNKSFDKRTKLKTREMLCCPLVFEGQLQGVLQLMNPVDRPRFSTRDVESARAISEALAVAFASKAHLQRSVQRTRFDLLFEQKLLNEAQLANARGIARENALFLEDVLRHEFNISKEALLASYATHARRHSIDLEQLPPPPADLVSACSEIYDQLKSGMWCPVMREGDRVVVALEDASDLAALDLIQAHFSQYAVDFRVAVQSDIIQAIDRSFSGATIGATRPTVEFGKRAGESEGAAGRRPATGKAPQPARADVSPEIALRKIEKEFTDISTIDSEDSGPQLVKLVNLIIEQAFHKGASDIHVEPYLEDDLVVRYRVDGELHTALVLPRELRNAIVSRVKIMSELDIAERRKPQDGKIKFSKFGRLDIELRVATLPTTGGCEDVVMRILAASKPLPLEQKGMSERNYAAFTELVRTPYGIILCVGPTGSGKTTTLHSALGAINDPTRKIWTAEDPVEITQKGLRQVQISPKAGLTFATAMRSFLRADPDVIMVGEMRDHETTAMGIEASLTGHLVFSTLHTNNAPETITRLLNMEVDVFAFGDALLGILAQRLVRTLCKKCKVMKPATAAEIEELRKEYGSDQYWELLGVRAGSVELPHPAEQGCGACSGSGYKGRMGLHELLVRSDEVRDLIYKQARADEIREVAMAQGMRTLKQDGVEKILAGHTDLRQVRMVCTQ